MRIKKGFGDMIAAKPLNLLVPEVGIEPTRGCPRGILSPVRLPISPLRHLLYYVEIPRIYNISASP